MRYFARHSCARAPAAITILALAALLGGACGPVVVRRSMALPASAPAAGCIVVRLTRAVPNLTVAINGSLVLERKRAERLEVRGVPVGRARVEIAAGGGLRERLQLARNVTVRAGAATVVLVAAPKDSDGAWIYRGLSSLGTWIAIAAMLLLL